MQYTQPLHTENNYETIKNPSCSIFLNLESNEPYDASNHVMFSC
jgi:hypothetical protein